MVVVFFCAYTEYLWLRVQSLVLVLQNVLDQHETNKRWTREKHVKVEC